MAVDPYHKYFQEKKCSLSHSNATQFCPFANQICKWLAKYLYINDKDV